eukprot:TRINITY_DN7999_c0_g1_i1.p1 TRINITY_DN7999_c0_g1~~TRINITY_DN7999_c0_g1_i1.p1  ORF type:complete len:230 (-),score=15.16 TRINITY_DN7999_c0_g1_i1:4-693(-)
MKDICPRSFVPLITEMYLAKDFKFTDSDMRIISQCTNLKKLTTNSNIESSLWNHLSTLKNLECLIMEGLESCCLEVISNFTKLKHLSIDVCQSECPRDSLVKTICCLQSLESLSRIFMGKAKLWSMFPVLPNLREIEVHFSEPKREDVTEMVAKFKLFPNLRYLTMTVHDPVPDYQCSLICLVELTQLTHLRLHIAQSWPESAEMLSSVLRQKFEVDLSRCYLVHEQTD